MINNCKTAIDACVGNLCENGASCVDKHLRYSCVCAAGYTGERSSTCQANTKHLYNMCTMLDLRRCTNVVFKCFVFDGCLESMPIFYAK